MNINLSVSEAPGIVSDYLVSAVYEANPDGSVGPLVNYQAFAAPHTSPRNISYTGLDINTYVHILWQNSAATPGGTIRHQFIYDPNFSNSTIEVREDLILTVDAGADNPVSGGTTFTRADLENWEYSIERRPGGTLIPDTEVVISNVSKTWTLQSTVEPFFPGEVFVVHFTPQLVTAPVAVTNSGRVFTQTDIITADATLVTGDVGKMKLIQSATDSIVITLPDLSLIQKDRNIGFISDGGSHICAVIKCAGTDTFMDGATQLILGQNERAWVYKSLDQSNIARWTIAVLNSNQRYVGEVFHSFKNTETNAVFANGALLDRVVYARLWAFVQTLPVDMIVSDVDWNDSTKNNYSRFSLGDGSTTFRIPRLYAYGFMRGVDGSARKSGSFQDHAMINHQHETASGTLPSTLFGRGIIGRLLGLYNGAGSNYTDLTSAPRKSDGSDLTNVDTETRPTNTGMYLMIRI